MGLRHLMVILRLDMARHLAIQGTVLRQEGTGLPDGHQGVMIDAATEVATRKRMVGRQMREIREARRIITTTRIKIRIQTIPKTD
jgi:hypothetical protein